MNPPLRREALGRVILSLVVWASPAAAQFSFTPRPAPEARWFLVSEFGAVLNLNRWKRAPASSSSTGSSARCST